MITLGKLVDELTVVNLKIWHLEDVKRDAEADDTAVANATRKTNVLNGERNNLIETIDQLIADYIGYRKKPEVSSVGSTKVYGKQK